MSKAQQCEALGQGRKALRKLMIIVYGGHSAYHDTKTGLRIEAAHQVQSCKRIVTAYEDILPTLTARHM